MADPVVFRDAASMREFSRQHRTSGKTISVVPTMGYLHEGHLSLVELARSKGDIVVVSIYVNPTQFSKDEDFDVYPRNKAGDMAKLRELGVDAVFQPTTLYTSGGGPDGSHVVGKEGDNPYAHETYVQVEKLQRGLCGMSRPHFFRGVATVVAKLFNIVEPDYAVFGKKDYQQWRIICRMVRDLDFPVQVIGGEISRAADGLALSSRNALLTPEHRQKAVAIYAALKDAKVGLSSGEPSWRSAQDIIKFVESRITEAGGRVDYVKVVDGEVLSDVTEATPHKTIIAVAAFFGAVRLIDNIEL